MKKNPGGKIYNRIVNSKQKITKRKEKEEQHSCGLKKKSNTICTLDPAVTDAVLWLGQNTEPWGTTLEKWVLSFPARQLQLMKHDLCMKLLKDFYHYADEFGYQLVSIYFFLYAKRSLF